MKEDDNLAKLTHCSLRGFQILTFQSQNKRVFDSNTLQIYVHIRKKENWPHKFIHICIEGGEKAGQCSGKAYLAIREGGNLPPLEKKRDSSPTRELGNPGISGA